MAKITIIATSLLLIVALSSAAPAEKAPREKADLINTAEAKQDLDTEKDDLKTAASHWGGGWGYGGHYGSIGHWGGGYPYWGGSYYGYPGYGYGFGGWPYYGGGWGYGHGGYWW